MQDRRIFERLPANLSLKFLNLKENTEGFCRICDISAKGLGLVTKERLQQHSPLEMCLEIPDKGKPLYMRGEVVWSSCLSADEYRAGVCLNNVNLMSLGHILRIS